MLGLEWRFPDYQGFSVHAYNKWSSCILFLLQDKEPKGIIPLENISIREVPPEKANKPFSFELFATGQDIIKACKVDKEGKVVEGKENSHDENFHYGINMIGKCVFFLQVVLVLNFARFQFCSICFYLKLRYVYFD